MDLLNKQEEEYYEKVYEDSRAGPGICIENYVGAVGPSKYNEAQAGYRLAKYYIEQGYTDFAVIGGSIMYGAEPHAYRVGGMFEAMIEAETGIQSTNFTE